MTITQRGSAVTSTDNSGTTVDLSAPTGLQVGDLEIIAVADDNAAGNLLSASGSGWATLASSPVTSGQHYSTIFWRVCPTVETVTVTFENTAARALGRTAFYWDGSGLTGWTKIDEDAAHTSGTASSLGAPTIDVEEDQLFLLAATNDSSNLVTTDPADMTEVFDIEGASAACALFYELSAADGSSPAKTVGWEGTDEASIIVGSFRAEVSAGTTHALAGEVTSASALAGDLTVTTPGSPVLAAETEGSDSGGGPWSTEEIDVVDGCGYLLAVTNWYFGADPDTPTVDASAVGLTFTQVATRVAETTGDNRIRLTLFKAIAEADDTGAISIEFSGNNFGGAWTLTRVTEFDPLNFVVQSVTDYTDSTVSSFEIGAGTTGTPLAAFADALNAVVGFWALRLALVTPTATADGLNDLQTVQHDEPVGSSGDLTLFVAGAGGQNLSPAASWSPDTAAAVAGIAIEIGHLAGGTQTLAGHITSASALSGNLTIQGEPEPITGASFWIRPVREVTPPRVYLHDAEGHRVAQLVTAGTVNRAFGTMMPTTCTFRIVLDTSEEPHWKLVNPRDGRLVVVESEAYLPPWVGFITDFEHDGNGIGTVTARSLDGLLGRRYVPFGTSVTGTVGRAFRDLLNAVNAENETTIAPSGSLPAGEPLDESPAFGGMYLYDALTNLTRDAGWEWWVEYEVTPRGVVATAFAGPARGERHDELVLVAGPTSIRELRSSISVDGRAHRIAVVAGQDSVTQAFGSRPRSERRMPGLAVGAARLVGSESFVHGLRVRNSPLSASAYTRHDRVAILDHLRGTAAAELAAEALLTRSHAAEDVLQLRVGADARMWEHVRPGNAFKVDLPEPCLIDGYRGWVRVLATQPMEENGYLDFVCEVVDEE